MCLPIENDIIQILISICRIRRVAAVGARLRYRYRYADRYASLSVCVSVCECV